MARRAQPAQQRIYLPHRHWPEADRAAWDAAVAVGDVFEAPGRASHWAAATRQSNRQHYARWLGWLAATGELTDEAPEDRVTLRSVQAYLRTLQATVAPRTAASALIGLKEVMRVLAPDRDWRWLMDLTNRVHVTAKPSLDRRSRLKPISSIFCAARTELDRLRTIPLRSRRDRVAYRDALAVMLLAACPVRLKNLTGIALGRHLTREARGWVLRIPAEETKTRRPLTLDVPANATPYLELYLDRVRSSFQADPACAALWLTYLGQPLTAHSLALRIVGTTKRLLGAALNPHLFRASAATSLFEQAPQNWAAAAAVLGHRNVNTTQRAYLFPDPQAASLRASALLSEIRDRKR